MTTLDLDGRSVVAHADHIVVEEFDDGVVVWHGPTEGMHRLDRPGAAVWAVLDGCRDLDEVSAKVAEFFGLGKHALFGDVRTFVGDLVERQLVTVKRQAL
jgi:hypothetical protein